MEILQQQLLQEQALLLVMVARSCAADAPPSTPSICAVCAPPPHPHCMHHCGSSTETDCRGFGSHPRPWPVYRSCCRFSRCNPSCMRATITLAGSQRIPRMLRRNSFVCSHCVCPHMRMTSKRRQDMFLRRGLLSGADGRTSADSCAVYRTKSCLELQHVHVTFWGAESSPISESTNGDLSPLNWVINNTRLGVSTLPLEFSPGLFEELDWQKVLSLFLIPKGSVAF